jgi:FKBP-type peptidyl-prolyl cis-trans isomerase FkpA
MTKFFNFTIAIATLVILISSCKPRTHKTPGGVEYKIIKDVQGDKIVPGDKVFFALIMKAQDTVIMNSAESPTGYRVEVKEAKGNFDEVLTMLSPGDSATFKINRDTFYTNYFHQPVPEFMAKRPEIQFNIRIDSVITKKTMDDRKKEKEKKMQEDQGSEGGKIEEYLKNNGNNFTTTSSGLHYRVTKTTNGRLAKTGDTVFVNYTGKLFNGNVFDSNAGKDLFSFVIGKQQVIQGWDEAFQLLHEGEQAVLVIPSSLGYAQYGAGADIQPFTPLVFEVELVKVKPGKK